MALSKYFLILALVLGFCCGCSCNKTQELAELDKPDTEYASGEQGTAFALRMFQAANQQGENLFFSPYSISTALSMVYGGARGNTAEQMAKALSFARPAENQHEAMRSLQQALNDLQDRGNAELTVANAIFGARKYEDYVLPEFQTLMRKSYASELYSLDFGDARGSADFINRWVERKTKERIKNLVNAGHIEGSNHGMVLVNAIYFKGNWLTQFDPNLTREDRFYTSSRSRSASDSRPVMMMHSRGDYRYAELPGLQVLELPYEEEELSMLVLLPDDIDALAKDLTPANLSAWQQKLGMSQVKVFMPKFKLDISLEGIVEILKGMGMQDAFNSNTADFSRIRDEEKVPGLFIMDIVHKAFVEVNEEGTEAAAATGVVMSTKAAAGPTPQIPVFRADKPFIYMILHKPSNTLLFLGKLNQPPQIQD